MALKLLSITATLAILIATGVVILLMMLVAMNGFSESDATWGLGAYLVLMVLIIAAAGAGAAVLASRLVRKGNGKAVAMLIAVPMFCVGGVLLEIVAGVIGVAVAEVVRVNF